MTAPDCSVVILTMGDRPGPLDAAMGSVFDQTEVVIEVIVVANGVEPGIVAVPRDPRCRLLHAPVNLGIPGGRNLGAEHARGRALAFLDDDARLIGRSVLHRAVERLDRENDVGAIALRIVDPTGVTARRHVPRVGARRPGRSGDVTAFLGGAVVFRRVAFEQVGAYFGELTYAMEETEIAWRLVDAGWRISYDGEPAAEHPPTAPSRHADHLARTMRNRVWIAARSLPQPLPALYVGAWLAITSLRHPGSAPSLLRTVWAARRTRPGPRRPIGWGAVWRLTKLGRPPVI